MMSEKKEVLDYLRNQQKAAEIEAKMEGVNIWVLLGAAAITAWKLMSTSAPRFWSEPELAVRSVSVAVALHMLSWLIRRSNSQRDDLRFERSNFLELESPALVLLLGVLIILPSLALWYVSGVGISVFSLGTFGIAFVIFSLGAIFKPIFIPQKKAANRLPEPDFGFSKREDFLGDLVVGFFLLTSLWEQVKGLLGVPGHLSIEEMKAVSLLTVLYMLLLATVERKRRNDSIAWTYELETDLIVGAVTADSAIRKIELRRLGPRLEDIVFRFLDDLDQRFSGLQKTLQECEEKVRAAKDVPEEYPVERAARIKVASEMVAAQIDSLADDCSSLENFLSILDGKANGRFGEILAPVLSGLRTRYHAYLEGIENSRQELRRILR